MAATIDTLTPVSQVQPDRIVAPLLLLGQLPGAKFTVHPHFPSVGHGDVERHRCPAQSHVDSKMPIPSRNVQFGQPLSYGIGINISTLIKSTGIGAAFSINALATCWTSFLRRRTSTSHIACMQLMTRIADRRCGLQNNRRPQDLECIQIACAPGGALTREDADCRKH